MHDLAQIEQHFPLKAFREGQKECIEAILNAFNSDKKFVILEAPTGSGKSVIGMTIAKFFQKSYYLTIQKILQDQLTKDFESDEVKSLKGRNAYPCDYWAKFKAINKDRPEILKTMEIDARNPHIKATMDHKRLPCSEGVCMVKEAKSKCKLCFPTKDTTTCQYYQAVDAALRSDTCIMNFHSFLYQTVMSTKFGIRDLLIVDEAHNAEPQLMDFISLSISDRGFRKDKIIFPRYNSAEEYAQYFDSIQLHELIAEKIRFLRYTNQIKDAEEWKQTLHQYTVFMSEVGSGNWIPKFEEKKGSNILTLKPIFVDKFANQYLFNKADKVLMMSATILSPKVMYDSLGIDPTTAYAYRMKNRFPVENRPIYFNPIGSMSFKNKQATKPKLVKAVQEICNNYPDMRGIIHTHNFELADLLLEEVDLATTKRFLYQKNFNSKDELLKKHAETPNGIIIAPAMHEGLSLDGDLSRFQIICKVPFPALGDNEQLKIRIEASPEYMDWLTSLKLVQSYGRSIRSETDWADTFILDSDFEFFRKKASKLLPDWFKEAIETQKP